MSTSSVATTTGPQVGNTTIGRPSAAAVPWTWMLLACVLLGGAVAVRDWQDLRFRSKLKTVEVTPFPLKSLPYVLGDWHAKEGQESTLDPEILKMIGSTDHIVRDYVNELTGGRLTVVITFGRADATFGHVPEVCYPSAGFAPAEAPSFHQVDTGGGHGLATFRSEVFAKSQGQLTLREEVYYSFRHNERWSPSAIDSWKLFRVMPSMFKVQVQRRVVEHELRDQNNPTEQFLKALLPEIESRIRSPSLAATDSSSKAK